MIFNQNVVTNVARAIAASAFLSVAVMLPQAGFAQQQSPGAVGDPRVDEPNTNTRINDPARPINEQNNNTSGPNAGSNGNTSTPNSQMNNSGFGSGSGAGGMGAGQSSPDQPANRIERYSQPGATDPTQNTEYVPPSAGNSENRGNDRYTSPNSAPGRGTYSSPRSQTDGTSSGGGAGGVEGSIDNRINNSTSPGSATPGSGSTNNNQLNTPSGTNNNSNPSNYNNNNRTNYDTNTNTGGGTGGTSGSGAVPGLW